MRVDLTRDEVQLLMMLAGGCDDADPAIAKVAMRLERYFRRRLQTMDQTEETDERG